jgi:CRP/FNR family transcriptional regulator, cyclic AMP receptor protein
MNLGEEKCHGVALGLQRLLLFLCLYITDELVAMLENISLFATVPASYLIHLEQHCCLSKYPKNTVLVNEGDESNHLYIIRKGSVCAYSKNAEGRQVNLNYMQEGDYFGELSLLDGRPRSASVMTLTNCEIILLARANVLELIQQYPEFAMQLLTELTQRVRELTDSVKDMALLDVYGRVSNALEKLADEHKRIHSPKFTHQDIANMVGSSREMVSRIMKQLVIGEYIEQCPSYIEIKKQLPRYW